MNKILIRQLEKILSDLHELSTDVSDDETAFRQAEIIKDSLEEIINDLKKSA